MASGDKKWQRPKVVFQPAVHRGMLRGVEQLVGAIRPTLGPLPRIVLYDRSLGSGRVPELLDDGGTIARRIIQIRGRDADVGAMLLRQMLWSLREEVGDGTATAAVMFEAAYREGVRYLTSGGDAMRLRTCLERGLREILSELDGMATRVEGKEALTALATTVSRDPELGKLMGEIFDIIGEYGRLEIRKGRGRHPEREYVEGMYWEGGLFSRALITDVERQRAELHNSAILMSDLEIEDPRDLIPTLTFCVREKVTDLTIIARRVSDLTIGMLLMNREKGKIKLDVIAVKTPGVSADDQRMALIDMAVLTGGRALFRAAGDTLKSMKAADLGHARRVWADRNNLGIIGGQGDPRQLREHIASLRAAHARATDADERGKLQVRIGQLLGGSATLRVGGTTETELDFNKEQATRAAGAMRGAMREGVLPGGGAALLACRPMLEARMAESEDSDQRAAYRILLAAMEAPARALLQNAGYDPSATLGRLDGLEPGHGFDVITGKVVDLRAAGILDITTVVKSAVRSAVATTAMALTTDVVVHRAKPPEALTT